MTTLYYLRIHVQTTLVKQCKPKLVLKTFFLSTYKNTKHKNLHVTEAI